MLRLCAWRITEAVCLSMTKSSLFSKPEDLFELDGDKKGKNKKRSSEYEEWEKKRERQKQAIERGEKLKKMMEEKEKQNGKRN